MEALIVLAESQFSSFCLTASRSENYSCNFEATCSICNRHCFQQKQNRERYLHTYITSRITGHMLMMSLFVTVFVERQVHYE